MDLDKLAELIYAKLDKHEAKSQEITIEEGSYTYVAEVQIKDDRNIVVESCAYTVGDVTISLWSFEIFDVDGLYEGVSFPYSMNELEIKLNENICF